jgi:hypothetical protein
MTKALESHELDHRELLARQGLRFPAIILRHLRSAGIYCQPTVSIEHQHLAKRYVLRGVESGGAIADLGAYSSFTDEQGSALAWLQRVDTVGLNGVHAIVVAPVLVRIEMLRVERTYDVLITRHSLQTTALGQRTPRHARNGALGQGPPISWSGISGLLQPQWRTTCRSGRVPGCSDANIRRRVLCWVSSLSRPATEGSSKPQRRGSRYSGDLRRSGLRCAKKPNRRSTQQSMRSLPISQPRSGSRRLSGLPCRVIRSMLPTMQMCLLEY